MADFCIGRKRSAIEFAHFVTEMAQRNPQGFRTPGKHADNWSSTSLVEQAAIAAGMMDNLCPERSDRSERKAVRHKLHIAFVLEQQEQGLELRRLRHKSSVRGRRLNG